MVTLDFRWVLFVIILLPLLAVTATVAILAWIDRRRRIADVLMTLQPLLEHAPLGMVAIRKRRYGQPQILYANAYAYRLWGAELTQFLIFLTHDKTGSLLEVDAAGPNRHPGFYRVVESDAAATSTINRRVRWWVTPWYDLTLLFFLDKTEQQQLDQTFNLLMGRLAHELRTPLETILTHLEVLNLPGAAPEQQRQSIAFAKSEAQRLVRLSNGALELARLENRPHIEMELVDLAALVDSVVAQLSGRVVKAQMTIRIDNALNLPTVVGNGERLRQVFTNLINNSIEHGDPGVQITIALQPVSTGIQCTVRDTGPGIDAIHLSRLTEPFYRAIANNRQSTGLGLAIVAEILHLHRTKLIVESITADGMDEAGGERATGTSMSFVLPMATEATA